MKLVQKTRTLPRRDPPRRSLTRDEWIASLRWNIKDAAEALQAAVSMRRWDAVVRYARQLQSLESKLHRAETATPRREHVGRVMSQERVRRANEELGKPWAQTEARRAHLRRAGWQFGHEKGRRT